VRSDRAAAAAEVLGAVAVGALALLCWMRGVTTTTVTLADGMLPPQELRSYSRPWLVGAAAAAAVCAMLLLDAIRRALPARLVKSVVSGSGPDGPGAAGPP
jgi:hypothetical protein